MSHIPLSLPCIGGIAQINTSPILAALYEHSIDRDANYFILTAHALPSPLYGLCVKVDPHMPQGQAAIVGPDGAEVAVVYLEAVVGYGTNEAHSPPEVPMTGQWTKGIPTEPGLYCCFPADEWCHLFVVYRTPGGKVGSFDEMYDPTEVDWFFPIPLPPGAELSQSTALLEIAGIDWQNMTRR